MSVLTVSTCNLVPSVVQCNMELDHFKCPQMPSVSTDATRLCSPWCCPWLCTQTLADERWRQTCCTMFANTEQFWR